MQGLRHPSEHVEERNSAGKPPFGRWHAAREAGLAWPSTRRVPVSIERALNTGAEDRRRAVLYAIVSDNLETLYGAIGDGALDIRLPKHAIKELNAYLDCGLLCRGFARIRCDACDESRLVAFACKGRGFCPSCMGPQDVLHSSEFN